MPALKVRELIEKLQALPDTAKEFPVYYTDCQEGDTSVADVVVSSLDETCGDGPVAVFIC